MTNFRLFLLLCFFAAAPAAWCLSNINEVVQPLIAEGDFAAAKSAVDSAYAVNASDPITALLHAQFVSNGTLAVEEYKKIATATSYPDSIRAIAYYKLGCAASANGKYQKATQHFKNCFARSRQNASDYVYIRSINAQHDPIDTAVLSLLQKQIADSAAQSFANFCMGLYSFAHKNYTAALSSLSASAEVGDSLWWNCAAITGSYYCALSLNRNEEASMIQTRLNRLYSEYIEKHVLLKVKQQSATVSDTKNTTPAKAAAKKTCFTIQVGAFGSQDNAELLRTDLAKKFSPVSISSGTTAGKSLYRVCVGAFATKDKAQVFADSVFTKNKLTFRIVEDTVGK